jgi:class 3 adenylate cyclase
MNPSVRDTLIRCGADPEIAAAIARRIAEGEDYQLVRIDPLQFAAEHRFDDDRTIDAFVHAAKVGAFEMIWDMLCPGCGTVLDESKTLKGIDHEMYPCRLCHLDNRPDLDALVEISFTVTPGTRAIAAHDPDAMGFWDYYRDFAFSRMVVLPVGPTLAEVIGRVNLGNVEVHPGGSATVESAGCHGLVFEPVTHSLTNIEIAGEPSPQVQDVVIVYTSAGPSPGEVTVRPGPVRFTLENRSNARLRATVMKVDDDTRALFHNRAGYLTAKRLFTNQVFRDQFRADVMDLDQRLKVTSLSVMFTDLKGSTELYDRVGDLAAFDLVRQHFGLLGDVIRSRGGAIVKTIGDAVMATFATPERAIAAALDIRRAMTAFNASSKRDDLVVKIGVHEGPCLAVTLNDRIDYFGQTINIAARVQGLAKDTAIFTTAPVVAAPAVRELLAGADLVPVEQKATLRGVRGEVTVFEIP